jgi:L-serine dehydratase
MYSQAINTSIFDLFKVGPGPSSSHTIGPMKAAFDFLTEINCLPTSLVSKTLQIEIYLYGSLSATGKGHGTDRAIIAGLMGWKPDACDPVKFLKILKNPDEKYPVQFHEQSIEVNVNNFFFQKGKYDSPHVNTMVLKLKKGESILLEHEYYSIGGGFIYRKGEKQNPKKTIDIPFPYTTMKELKAHLNKEKISLSELMLANEMALTNTSKKEIEQKIDTILDFMHKAVKRGLKDKRVLPGTIKLRRKAPLLYERAKNLAITSDSFLIFLNAYCLAASEENAAGNIVVTAPTSGASGVIPGITYLIKNHFHYSASLMRDGMWAAAAIGFLVKHNASISGAEMGCMGEIGTASAMAAAMLTYCATKNINDMESAAEIGIEHHLGMTCDPIGGYVQIPCIERNAMGAVKSYNAFLLATSGDSSLQKISFDSVIKVMKATGKDMSKKYKETSEAGLALSATEC